ncbi:MAG TPA: Clp protease ClpP [Bacteroidia bacterium]|nr:Clp protease ClpP [Bacteroidia bacterium]
MNNSYIINQNENSAEILLYGFIGNWKDTDSNRFISDFKKLETTNKKINVRINSGGGDVFDGITIYNALKNSKAEINTYIDGVAASMASVIALAGSKIYMSRYAQLMIHRVSGSANGDSDKLRETANLMDDLSNSLLDIYAAKTGIDKETIQNSWMQRGKDSWFNATEAISQKLVDAIFDGVISKQALKKDNPEEVWKFYNLQIENSLRTNDMNILNRFITVFGLPESATEQDVVAAYQNHANQLKDQKIENEKLKNENEAFKTQIQTFQKQKVQDLIEDAIKSNRITEEQRLTYVALAESNFDATKVALNSIAPYKSITSQIQTTSDDSAEYKTFREYQEKAPEVLATMKENDTEKYNALYKKEYGKLPRKNSL